MITLSFLKFLEDNGFGAIDKDLFWQKIGLETNGVYIVSIGQPATRFTRRAQRYELYSRAKTDFEALRKLEAIANFLNSFEAYGTCSLPAVPKYEINDSYRNVTILPVSTPTRVGKDQNDQMVWSVSGTIIYQQKEKL